MLTDAGWAKLRNVLAHEYLDIRWESVKSFLKDVDPLANEFVKGVNLFTGADNS